jgi:TPR repeat protein
VRTDGHGLIYPRQGVSYCTGPELIVALNLGAKLQVARGVLVPWRTNGEHADLRPFVEFTSRGDYETALRELRLLAEQGDAGAQYNLGTMYAEGLGVSQDDVEAVRWCRLAAE